MPCQGAEFDHLLASQVRCQVGERVIAEIPVEHELVDRREQGELTGRHKWRQKTPESETWAAFLWGLPVLPVLLSVVVLGVTYL